MRLISLFRDSIFIRALLVLWIISTALIIYLLTNIDRIVHKDLYNYGLQFSLDWAVPYWMTFRFILVFLAVPSVLSGAALVTSILGKGEENKKPIKHVGTPQRPKRQRPQPTIFEKELEALGEEQMVVSCPKCKRVFGKPLAMLDFSGGTTRLVNICPYCNRVLGNADDKQAPSEDVGVIDLNKRKVEER